MIEFNWTKGDELTDNKPGKWIVVWRGGYEVYESMVDAFITFSVYSTPTNSGDHKYVCLLQHYSPRQWIVHKSEGFWVM